MYTLNVTDTHMLLLILWAKLSIYVKVAPRNQSQPVRDGLACKYLASTAKLMGNDGMGGGRSRLDDVSHCTETMPDPGTQNAVGHKGRWQGRTVMAGWGGWVGCRAQSHLKGRRGVQLKLLIRELRKATRSETKGAR